VKTPQGYVAQNNLIACLSMLTIDTCVTPKGDLLVACHSGPPDCGTGPAGDGKIFRIRYTGRDTPQPVLAWAAAADEFRIAFDKPLRDADWAGARARTRIEAGRYVSAADRFEVIRPGYQVVLDQMATPRRWVDVQSLSLSADRRTIVLRVPRQTEAVNYAVTLPTPASWQTRGPIHQKPELDLALSLNGIQVMIYANGMTSNIVLPHPSPTVARALTAGSADHDAFLQRLEETKACVLLSLRGGIDIANVFVPATQPGATLDWDIDADAFANRSMTVQQDLSSPVPRNVALKAEGKSTVAPLQLELTAMPLLDQGGLYFALDDRVRPIALNRLLASWVTTPTEKPGPAEPVARTDVKGNWLHGRRVFFGDAGCGTCHTVRGEGIAFGPDLSNLIFRDRESVLQDILNPSATINPDHTGTTVKFKDGAEVNGIPTTINDEKIVLRLPANGELVRPRRDVVSIEPMKNSLMTETFGQSMTAEQREDLLTFLLTNPLEPAPITRLDPPMPPARTRDDVAAFVSASAPAPANQPPLRILLCIDDQDHGLDEHDYPLWQKRWSRLLALADNVTVETARGFPSRELLAASDVTVFYSRNSGWGQQAAALMDEYQQRGGGLVYLHWGMEGGKEAPALAERIGLATGRSKFRHGDMELNFTKSGHPITKGFDTLKFTDETYWAFFGDPKRITPLATAVEEGESRIQLWVFERGKARVFGSIPGHYTWTFDDPLYRVIVLRGIAWVSHQEDINRLVDLALVGARIAP
jgi:putative heme-binding domain-containing protein